MRKVVRDILPIWRRSRDRQSSSGPGEVRHVYARFGYRTGLCGQPVLLQRGGRFLSADPYVNSAGPTEPGSWNRYAYTRGDPTNRVDPEGLDDSGCGAFDEDFCEDSPILDGGTFNDPLNMGIAPPGMVNIQCDMIPGGAAGGLCTVSDEAYQMLIGEYTPSDEQFAQVVLGGGIGVVCAGSGICEVIAVTAAGGWLVWGSYQLGTAIGEYIKSHTSDNSSRWPPCSPPVGTIGYRLDQVPPSRPHYPYPGDHVHLSRMQQKPNTGQCFWQPIGVTAPPPPPGAVQIGPAAGGTNR